MIIDHLFQYKFDLIFVEILQFYQQIFYIVGSK